MKQTANILAMFTMKFVIKMYASSMKIALHTYFWVVCIGNCQCGPCNALLIAHSLCQKKKKKNTLEEMAARFPALGPHKLGLLI